MLTTLKERLGRNEQEEGFTLIELMVVVLIIAILLAIAIPTFLGARNSANARASQSNLRNGLTAEQTYFTNNQSFTGNTADMLAVEPNLTWTTTAPTTKGGSTVYIAVYSGLTGPDAATAGPTGETGVLLEALGQDGNCYAIFQANAAISTLAAGTYYGAYKPAAGTCLSIGTIPTADGLAGTKATTTIGLSIASWYPSW